MTPHRTRDRRIQDFRAPVWKRDRRFTPNTCLRVRCSTSMLRLHLHPLTSHTSGPCPSPTTPLPTSLAWVTVWSCPLSLLRPTWRLQPTSYPTSSRWTIGACSTHKPTPPAWSTRAAGRVLPRPHRSEKPSTAKSKLNPRSETDAPPLEGTLSFLILATRRLQTLHRLQPLAPTNKCMWRTVTLPLSMLKNTPSSAGCAQTPQTNVDLTFYIQQDGNHPNHTSIQPQKCREFTEKMYVRTVPLTEMPTAVFGR